MRKIIYLLLFALSANLTFAQFPEGFEGATFPPPGWTSFIGNNGLGTDQNWMATSLPASGANSAAVNSEFVDGQTELFEDWLVTPEITVTSANSVLTFSQSHFFFGESNSSYTIRVSTTGFQSTIADYTIVDTQAESQIPDAYQAHSVNLSAYIGQAIYVAFVFSNNTVGDNWYIDNVTFVDASTLPSCAEAVSPAPGAVDVAFDSTNFNSITFNWSAPASGPVPENYVFYFGTSPDSLQQLYTTAETTFDVTQFNYNTTYYWQVIASSEAGTATSCPVYSFTTVAETPQVPDFFTDFNDGYSTVPQWRYGSGAFPGPPTPIFLNDWNYYDYANDFTNGQGLGAYINLYDQDEQQSDWFISPLFDLSGGTHYLNFDIALTQFNDTAPAVFSANEYIALLASTDDGATWSELRRWDQNNPVSNVGQPVSEILLNQTGNTRFAFYASVTADTTSDIDFFIDNFRITGASLGLSHNETLPVAFYPNPVKDILSISCPENISEITVTNVLGQQVIRNAANSQQYALDMSALDSGTYFVKINSDGGEKNIKVLKL